MSASRLGGWAVLLAASCARPTQEPPRTAEPAAPAQAEIDRQHVAELVDVEARALDLLAAADPRLSARLGTTAPKSVLDGIGIQGVLAEDAAASIHDGALDLFGFRARALAIDHAAKIAAGFEAPLPDAGEQGSALGRPRLELELLRRLIEEESARAVDEAKLGEASGDLVRGMLSTWRAPSSKDAWQERDGWVAKHLLEIQKSLQDGRPRTGPLDLDEALYPLERLLAPLEFPKGAAALARVRMALDEDTRAAPPVASAESLGHGVKVHLGVGVDAATLKPRLEIVEAHLRERAVSVLSAAGEQRPAIEARARELLFVEGKCPPTPASRVRTAAPPPERAAICGLLSALGDESSKGAAVVALHDDVLLAFAAIDRAPPARTLLLCKPDDDRVDALRRLARERPVVALGLALAAEVLYGDEPAAADKRTAAWLSLGEAPLDVVSREVRR